MVDQISNKRLKKRQNLQDRMDHTPEVSRPGTDLGSWILSRTVTQPRGTYGTFSLVERRTSDVIVGLFKIKSVIGVTLRLLEHFGEKKYAYFLFSEKRVHCV